MDAEKNAAIFRPGVGIGDVKAEVGEGFLADVVTHAGIIYQHGHSGEGWNAFLPQRRRGRRVFKHNDHNAHGEIVLLFLRKLEPENAALKIDPRVRGDDNSKCGDDTFSFIPAGPDFRLYRKPL